MNWAAVVSTDFRDMVIKEGKQAEFLIQESFPWHLVERIGVCSDQVAEQVSQAIAGADHHPASAVERDWYY